MPSWIAAIGRVGANPPRAVPVVMATVGAVDVVARRMPLAFATVARMRDAMPLAMPVVMTTVGTVGVRGRLAERMSSASLRVVGRVRAAWIVGSGMPAIMPVIVATVGPMGMQRLGDGRAPAMPAGIVAIARMRQGIPAIVPVVMAAVRPMLVSLQKNRGEKKKN